MGQSIFDEGQPVLLTSRTEGFDGVFVAGFSPDYAVPIRVDTLLATCDSAIDQVLQVKITNLFAEILVFGTVTIPAGAGYPGVPGVDLLADLTLGAVGGLIIPIGYTLNLESSTNLESGALCCIFGMGGSL